MANQKAHYPCIDCPTAPSTCTRSPTSSTAARPPCAAKPTVAGCTGTKSAPAGDSSPKTWPPTWTAKPRQRRRACRLGRLHPQAGGRRAAAAARADRRAVGAVRLGARQGRCGVTFDQGPPGGRNHGGPATVGKAGPTSNQNQPPPSTRFNRQPSAPARHFHAAGLRRREAALRLPPIGRCGCIRDPDHDRTSAAAMSPRSRRRRPSTLPDI